MDIKKNMARCLLVILLVLTTTVTSLAQDSEPEVADLVITRINGDDELFPMISVNFRVLDAAGDLVPDLTVDDISIAEGNQTEEIVSELEERADRRLWVRFVINGGLRMQGQFLENAIASIEAFTEEQSVLLFEDQIAISLTEGSGLTNPHEFSVVNDDLRQVLTTAVPCSDVQCTRPIASVVEVLERTDWPGRSAGGDDHAYEDDTQILIYLTGIIDDERNKLEVPANPAMIEELEKEAIDNDITIYTIVLDNTLDNNELANLAIATGGTAVAYEDVDELYDLIFARHRTYYAASYRTDSAMEGDRLVTVTYDGAGSPASDQGVYKVSPVESPQIVIEQPEEGEALSESAVEDGFVVNGRVVTINYEQRELATRQIAVNGELLAEENFEAGERDFSFTIPPESIDADSDSLEIVVSVIDEFNLSGEKSLTYQLPTVVVPPPIPPTAEPVATEAPPVADAGSAGGINDAVLLLGMAALAGALVFVVVRNRQQPQVKNVRNTIMRGVDRLTKRYQRQTEVKGYLLVLEGDSSMGKSLEIYGTTPIGRSKEDAELLFQQHDEHSPISRRHCTILDEEDHFKLRDEDSANGTYLNGVRLTPLEPRELFDGDEIELARVERGGVKIRFQGIYPHPEEELSEFDPTVTRHVPKPNRRPNYGQQAGDRF